MVLKTVLNKIIIAKHDADEDPVFEGQGAIVLGLIKGKPFVKITAEQNVAETQLGQSPLDMVGKYETSLLDVDSTTISKLAAIRGENVSLLCEPQGTAGANNPQIVIKNFLFNYNTELNIGGESTIKLFGSKPAATETDVFEYLQQGVPI